jgi:hypothetical protein
MSPGEIQKLQRATPFTPFRVHDSDGSSYAVRDPHHIVASLRIVIVGIGKVTDGVPTDSIYINPLHITRIEPLLSKGGRNRPSNGNGHTAG